MLIWVDLFQPPMMKWLSISCPGVCLYLGSLSHQSVFQLRTCTSQPCSISYLFTLYIYNLAIWIYHTIFPHIYIYMPYCRKHVYLPSGAVTLCSVALSGEDKEALRRMDTATTVPSVGLECHLFMVKLLGDHDFADRENPHDEILEWITKMKSWCNGTLEFINDLDVGVQPIFKELVQLIDQRQELVHEFQAFKASQEIRIQEEKGYTAMLSRQEVQSAKRGDSEQMIEKKQNLLKGWKQDKMDTIEKGNRCQTRSD